MGKKKIAREPLLYIHQPTNQTPKAPMQYNYVTPKKRSEPEQQQGDTSTGSAPKRPVKRNAYYKELNRTENSEDNNEVDDREDPEDSNEQNYQYDTDGQDEPEAALDKDKPSTHGESIKFKDMTLEEKVAYFVNKPSYTPKMRCEVKTEEKTYRGIITDYKENDVFIRVGKRSTSTQIPMDKISNIRMLGF
ncbi:hypothetical protein CIL05_12310 [Virgibacillus profundi]|uniref:Spore coat protein CotO n=1 Tax=Virgibacillus profundi TaxID=2024555 RepID=A0A2A2ID33_9BACI|nr:CotO family spore coat protein [Virgibacillus profundi]PAV29174.1 hypothetical protein CIL05_12310 [Virgibacillus profundi]PXY53343.1 hypothetical protein CIT14_12435 [Virgibacillus profundi]